MSRHEIRFHVELDASGGGDTARALQLIRTSMVKAAMDDYDADWFDGDSPRRNSDGYEGPFMTELYAIEPTDHRE